MTVSRRKKESRSGREHGEADVRHKKVVIKGWEAVRHRLQKKDPLLLEEEFCIFLEDVPKLVRKLKPAFYFRDAECVKSSNYDSFYLVGLSSTITKYTFADNGRNKWVKTIKFPYPMHSLSYSMESNLFVGLNPERTLVVFSMTREKAVEVCQVEQLFNARCITTIPETGQVVVGGVGFLKIYALPGGKCWAQEEQSSAVQPGQDIKTSLLKDEWVRDIKVDAFDHNLLVVVDSGIIMVNYREWREVCRLTDPDGDSITCCCLDGTKSFLITGSRCGGVKVWSLAIKVIHHHFIGHRTSITAIACHQREPVVVTGSADGWVMIWRLDTFRKFKQIRVGNDKVDKLAISSHHDPETVGFWCISEGAIHFYELSEPYRIFAAMDSTVVKLKRLLGHDRYPNRILVATWDGGVWFKNPVTAETVGFMYPIITLKNLEQYVYDVIKQKLYIILPTGAVLVLNCAKTPFRALEQMTPMTPDENVTSVVDVLLSVGTEEHSLETVAILVGLTNGQIDLMSSDNLHMNQPIQAHHGSVVGFETLTELTEDGQNTCASCRVLLSVGSDMCVKLWRLRLSAYEGKGSFELCLHHVVTIRCEKVPKYVAAVEDKIAIVYNADTTLEMYDLGTMALKPIGQFLASRVQMIHQRHCISHTKDYDHSDTVTALDKCPLLMLFATASMDKTVKIWDSSNNLIRELVFEEPVVDICFVSDIGDLLIARDFVLVYSSPEYYLPWSFLERMRHRTFGKELREMPKKVKDSDRAWVDPERVMKIQRRQCGRYVDQRRRTTLDTAVELEEWQLSWMSRGSGERLTKSAPIRVRRQKARRGSDFQHDLDAASPAPQIMRYPKLSVMAPPVLPVSQMSFGDTADLGNWPQSGNSHSKGLPVVREDDAESVLYTSSSAPSSPTSSIQSKSQPDTTESDEDSESPAAALGDSEKTKKPSLADTEPGDVEHTRSSKKPSLEVTKLGDMEHTRSSKKSSLADTEPGDMEHTRSSKKSSLADTEPGDMEHTRSSKKSSLADSPPGDVEHTRGSKKPSLEVTQPVETEESERSRKPSDVASLLDEVIQSGRMQQAQLGPGSRKDEEIKIEVSPVKSPRGHSMPQRKRPTSDTQFTEKAVVPEMSPFHAPSWMLTATTKFPSRFEILRHGSSEPTSESLGEDDDQELEKQGDSKEESKLHETLTMSTMFSGDQPPRYHHPCGLTKSETNFLMDKQFEAYCQQAGCGPVGPLMKYHCPSPPVSSSSSYADSEELAWHHRVMTRIPILPKSVITKIRRHRPPGPPSYFELMRQKVMDILDSLEDHRPALFQFHQDSASQPGTPAELSVVKKKMAKGKKQKKRRRKRGPPLIQWECVEDFAPIRRKMLPVFSTRLFAIDMGESPSEAALALGMSSCSEAAMTPVRVKNTKLRSKTRIALYYCPRIAKELTEVSGTISSSEVILHSDMINCLMEDWFPQDVPLKPLPIFYALLSLLDKINQVEVLLEVYRYLGVLCKEANLPAKLKRYTAYRSVRMACTHENPRVKAACVCAMPDMSPLNRVVLQLLTDSLRSENEDLRMEAAIAMGRYGIKTEVDLRHTHSHFQVKVIYDHLGERFALAVAEAALWRKVREGPSREEMEKELLHFRKLFGGSPERKIKVPKRSTMMESEYTALIAAMKSPRPEIRTPHYGDRLDGMAPKKPFTDEQLKERQAQAREKTSYLIPEEESAPLAPPTSPRSFRSDSSEASAATYLQQKQQQQREKRDSDAVRHQAGAAAQQDGRDFPGKPQDQDLTRSQKSQAPGVSLQSKRSALIHRIADKLLSPELTVGEVCESQSRSSLHFLPTDESDDGWLSDSSYGPSVFRRSGSRFSSRSKRTARSVKLGKKITEGVGREAAPSKTAKQPRHRVPSRARRLADVEEETLDDKYVLMGCPLSRIRPIPPPPHEGQRKPSTKPKKEQGGEALTGWLPVAHHDARQKKHGEKPGQNLKASSRAGQKKVQTVRAGRKGRSFRVLSYDNADERRLNAHLFDHHSHSRSGSLAASLSQSELDKPRDRKKSEKETSHAGAKSMPTVEVTEKPRIKPRGRAKPQSLSLKLPLPLPSATPRQTSSGYYWAPGEPGLRVHHSTVPRSTTPRGPPPTPAGIVRPLEGRLGVATVTEAGHSSYGALSLQWTTRTPTIPVKGVAGTLRSIKDTVYGGTHPAKGLGRVHLPGFPPRGKTGGAGGQPPVQTLPFSASVLIACMPPHVSKAQKTVSMELLSRQMTNYIIANTL